ncbi:MAG: hypothetical protein WKG01_20395 [Kofleriaceae bacterium]
MANFRETLWFKKGLLDAELAQAAGSDALEVGAVDLLPVEDRYQDDGSVSGADSAALSLATGTTVSIRTIPHGDPGNGIEFLARDMKRGRHAVIAAIGASMALVAVIAIYVI